MYPNKDVYLKRCHSGTLKKSSSPPHVIMGPICFKRQEEVKLKYDSGVRDFISNIYSCAKMLWPGQVSIRHKLHEDKLDFPSQSQQMWGGQVQTVTCTNTDPRTPRIHTNTSRISLAKPLL